MVGKMGPEVACNQTSWRLHLLTIPKSVTHAVNEYSFTGPSSRTLGQSSPLKTRYQGFLVEASAGDRIIMVPWPFQSAETRTPAPLSRNGASCVIVLRVTSATRPAEPVR